MAGRLILDLGNFYGNSDAEILRDTTVPKSPENHSVGRAIRTALTLRAKAVPLSPKPFASETVVINRRTTKENRYHDAYSLI